MVQCGYCGALAGYLNEFDEPENLHLVDHCTLQVHNFTTNSLHVAKNASENPAIDLVGYYSLLEQLSLFYRDIR